MSKKILAAALLSLTLIAAGCGAKTTNDGGAASPAPSGGAAEGGKNYTIAISQIVEHPSLDATRDGFLAALKDAGIEEGKNLKVEFDSAQDDQSNNLSIAQKIAGGKADLALGISTPSAQALVENVKKVPVLFAAVTDPVASNIVTSLDKPGGNVTGASDTNPAAVVQLMDFIASDFPKVKTVGMIINEGESNAVVMADNAEQALSKHGIKLVKAPVTNTSEVKQAAESLIGKADALFIALDNRVVSGSDAIIEVANANKIPFFSSDRDTVEKGAFATVGFKYYDHGYQVGEMAAEILKDGKNPGDMPVKMQEKLDLILNLKSAEAQGITVTDAMKGQVKDAAANIIQ